MLSPARAASHALDKSNARLKVNSFSTIVSSSVSDSEESSQRGTGWSVLRSYFGPCVRREVT